MDLAIVKSHGNEPFYPEDFDKAVEEGGMTRVFGRRGESVDDGKFLYPLGRSKKNIL